MSVEVNKEYLLGDFSLGPERRELRKGNQKLHLPRRPFQVLLYLIDHRDRVVSRRELLDRFWEGKEVYDETLTKCVGSIRKILNDGFDEHFIDTRYGEGYRYIGPVEFESSLTASAAVEIERTCGVKITVEEEHIIESTPALETTQINHAYAAATLDPSRTRTYRVAKLCAVAIIGILVTASGLFLYKGAAHSVLSLQPAAASSLQIKSVAVMPLRNLTGDASQDYLSDGITESLITQLSKIKDLKVISQNSVLTFKGQDIDPRDAAKRLNVNAVMEGSLRRSGDNLRVSVRVVNASDGHILWAADTSERTRQDVFALEEEVACNIAASLRVKLCGVGEPPRRTSAVEAYDAYLKGRYFISQQTSKAGPEAALRRAISYFQQAIAIDPKYAPAYAGLADCYTQLNWFAAEDPKSIIAKAKSAALKAVQLDDSSAEAHTALATADLHDWDLADAGKEHERALALNPGAAWAYHEYSTYLIAVGRTDQALWALEKAHDLDPLNPTIMADEANAIYIDGRYDEAIEMFRNVCKIDPSCDQNGEVLNSSIGLCLMAQGKLEDANRNFEASVNARGRQADPLVWLALGYAASGKRQDAEQILQEITKLCQKQYVPKIFIAYIETALGRNDQALKTLDDAYLEHDVNLISLRVNQFLAPLRSEERFQNLTRRIGLPDQSSRP
jgi:TolB-like protein/DNA-binding winged helix-turn-helix (wHTH) protein/tetratricopeptide (TPR) repeat protein